MFKTQSMALATGDGPRVAESGRASGADGRASLGSTWILRFTLIGGALAAVAVAACFGDPAAHLRADPALSHLLRGMAVIKAALALTALGVLTWRFARPISPATAVAYILGAWGMAAASMIVWRLSFIGVGALTFHAGELTLLVVAWREHRRESVTRESMTIEA